MEDNLLEDGLLTCRQLLLLQQDGVGHAQLGKVVEGLTAKAAHTCNILGCNCFNLKSYLFEVS